MDYQLAEYAITLLEDERFKKLFVELQEDLKERLVGTKPNEVEKREETYQLFLTTRLLQTKIQEFANQHYKLQEENE